MLWALVLLPVVAGAAAWPLGVARQQRGSVVGRGLGLGAAASFKEPGQRTVCQAQSQAGHSARTQNRREPHRAYNLPQSHDRRDLAGGC